MIMKAISIRQPWAGLIILGFKDIENRTWPAPGRIHGTNILIHAGKQPDKDALQDFATISEAAFNLALRAGVSQMDFYARTDAAPYAFNRGGVLGVAKLEGCVKGSSSPWAFQEPSTWHWQFSTAKGVKPFGCKGMLGFFDVDYPHQIEEIA